MKIKDLLIPALSFILLTVFCAVNNQDHMVSAKNRRILFASVPKDGSTIFYRGEKYSREHYKEEKSKELEHFKRALKRNFGLDFKTSSTKYFNIAYRCSERKMNSLRHYLLRFFDQIYPVYFKYIPDQAFHVIYFRDKREYTRHTGYTSYGVYRYDTKTLYTYTNSGHGTLWHEMIHAFVDTNCNRELQQWFNEGFASFYEMAFLHNNRVVEGYSNWRLPSLKHAIRLNSMAPLNKFLLDNRMRGDSGLGYSQARFLFCYLWVHKKMVPFVHSYLYELSPRYSGKELGEKAIGKIEQLTGKDISTIDREYLSMAMRTAKNQKLYQK